MHEVRELKAEEMFDIVLELLRKGNKSKMTVKGFSMYPFLRDGLDCVEFSQCCFDEIGRGDIVLTRRRNGQYIMHRVTRKEAGCFYMVGDAQQEIEGPLAPDQLLAVVRKLWRRDREVDCGSLALRMLVVLWMRTIRIRPLLFKAFGLCGRFRRNIWKR